MLYAAIAAVLATMAMALARVARHINPILQPENLRMLETGYKADFRPLARFLGHVPRAADASQFFSDGANPGSAS